MTTDTQYDMAVDTTADLLDKLRRARGMREHYDSIVTALNAELSQRIQDREQYTDANGQAWTASVVRGNDVRVNLERLRQLSQEIYEDVTSRVLDREAFNLCLENGRITKDIASEVATVTSRTPYVKFTRANGGTP